MKIALRLFWLFLSFFSLHAYGYDFVMGPLTYTILSEDDAKVEVAGPASTDITEAVIPQKVVFNNKSYTVTRIGHGAFYNCKNIIRVTIPFGVKEIDSSAFTGCESMEIIELPQGLERIGESAFWWCTSLKEIALPNSLISIGDYAFRTCWNLTSLYIPESVSEIGGGFIESCDRLENIKIAAGNYYFLMADGVLYNSRQTKVVACLKNQSSVTLPASVTEIGKAAFAYCTRLKKIDLSQSILTIGERAFFYCMGLNEIKLPNSVMRIGADAFNACIGITSITLPQSVSEIGENAFNTGYLENIEVHPWNKYFASVDGVLYNKELTTLLQCPVSKETVEIPDGLKTISISAFYQCGKIKSIEIPNSVTSIGASAFYSCTSLESVKLSNSVTVIDIMTFQSCTALKALNIPNSVEVLREYSFSGCVGATTLTIPESVKDIRHNVFEGCTSLSSIFMQPKEPVATPSEFSNEVYSTATLYVPIGTKGAYSTVEPWKNFANIRETDFAGVETPVAEEVNDLRIVVNGDTATIDGLEDGEEIAIYDMSGRLIHTGKDYTFAGLARGIYVVKAGAKTAKFTI